MDQYVSRCLTAEELYLDTIWSKDEDFCKPQVNKLIARFDLLTSVRQGNRSVLSGTMQYKHKCLLPNTHEKLQTSCIMTSFGFS